MFTYILKIIYYINKGGNNMIKALNEMKMVQNEINGEWLKYLYNTKEKNYNVLNVNSLKEINKHSVFNYVLRTLEILQELKEKLKIEEDIVYYVEETLKWSDVSKTGNKQIRKVWKNKKYDLFCHNIASAQIYFENNNDEVVYTLIKTHGLIGQYIKGEVNLNKNIELYKLIEDKKISKDKLKTVLLVLNQCIIQGVSKDLYIEIKDKVEDTINKIVNGKLEENTNILNRLQLLNKNLSFEDKKYIDTLDVKIKEKITKLFDKLELWFFESALSDFNIQEQIKILLLVYKYINEETKHLTLESLMKSLYLDYKNKKEINLYKKRIIEAYLKEITLEQIINDNINPNPHITYQVKRFDRTLEFNFKFSTEAKKLIEFCEVALSSNALYQKAIYMLYDLFGFRRDSYDRFYNELDYLQTMNSAVKDKSIILDYIVGKKVLDVGPGGGVMLDLIEKTNPLLEIYGIDLSQNVIDKLTKKKIEENHNWNIVKGDALNLTHYFKNNEIDTIIYSSIIHELYSYIEYEGKKFNKNTIKKSLQEAYQILKVGGRIIIRDGIMTEPVNDYRIIEFNNAEDLKILKRYCNDFQGRKIKYEKISENAVKMLVNDAMEFLYTYTWGEQSYPLEVKEQFGYFTIKEYVEFIKENLPNAKIIESKSFLQSGYEKNLLPKINIYDENMNVVKLPDSTSLIVIEKG